MESGNWNSESGGLRKKERKSLRRRVEAANLVSVTRGALLLGKKEKQVPNDLSIAWVRPKLAPLSPKEPSAHILGQTKLPTPIDQDDNELSKGASSIFISLRPPLDI
jgi:hypothetical protein